MTINIYRQFKKLYKFLTLVDVKNLKCIKNAFAEGKMNENFNGQRKEGDEKTTYTQRKQG